MDKGVRVSLHQYLRLSVESYQQLSRTHFRAYSHKVWIVSNIIIFSYQCIEMHTLLIYIIIR